MHRFIKNRFQPLHKLMISGAWFFVVISLLHLMWAAGMKIDNPDNVVKLYSTVVGEQVYDAWGLTYSGKMGLAQIFGQLLVVLAAALASTSKSNHPALQKARRISHTVLVIWSGWWAGNLLYLTNMDREFGSMLQASMMVALTLSTLYRAGCGWNGCKAVAESTSPDAPMTDLTNDTPQLLDEPKSTHAFFSAIAPEPGPMAAFKGETESLTPDDVCTCNDVATPPNRRDTFGEFCVACRERAAKLNAEVRKHVNPENAAKVKENASKLKARAQSGGAAAALKARSVAGRVKPVARTAWREARQAWKKTIASMKDGEPGAAHAGSAASPTEPAAS
jgi:hypothetical protein